MPDAWADECRDLQEVQNLSVECLRTWFCPDISNSMIATGRRARRLSRRESDMEGQVQAQDQDAAASAPVA